MTPKAKAIKNVVKREEMISSRGVEIQTTVPTNPEIIVAITPVPEYFLQKKVRMMAGESVQPTPAHAQLTIK